MGWNNGSDRQLNDTDLDGLCGRENVMVSIASSMTGARNLHSAAYTVICKSGQRGLVFDDPEMAAQAFVRARVLDRPFVLRHKGGASIVIASSNAGRKRIEPGSVDDTFRRAFESAADAEPCDRHLASITSIYA